MYKTPKLTKKTMKSIAKYKVANPKMTWNEIALHFSKTNRPVTIHQCKYAFKMYHQGHLDDTNHGKIEARKSAINAGALEDIDYDKWLEDQLKASIAIVEIDKDLTHEKKKEYIADFMKIYKEFDALQLHNKIKKWDIKVLVRVTEILKPGITKREFLELWDQAIDQIAKS